jgi:hypothetical protein
MLLKQQHAEGTDEAFDALAALASAAFLEVSMA